MGWIEHANFEIEATDSKVVQSSNPISSYILESGPLEFSGSCFWKCYKELDLPEVAARICVMHHEYRATKVSCSLSDRDDGSAKKSSDKALIVVLYASQAIS